MNLFGLFVYVDSVIGFSCTLFRGGGRHGCSLLEAATGKAAGVGR